MKGDAEAVDSKTIKEHNDKAKQWLWRYQEAKKDVRRLERELQELIETQESTEAIEYSDMPKGGENQSDLSDYMVKREKAWRKIYKARYKRIALFQEIKNAIEILPTADEREILSARYISKKTWEEICSSCRFGWRQMHRIHCKGLEGIYNFIKDGIE